MPWCNQCGKKETVMRPVLNVTQSLMTPMTIISIMGLIMNT